MSSSLRRRRSSASGRPRAALLSSAAAAAVVVLCMFSVSLSSSSSPLSVVTPVAAAAAEVKGAYPCQFTDSKGRHYDVSALAKGQDYEFKSTDSAGAVMDYWMNPCAPTVTRVCGDDCACCQEWQPGIQGGQACLGYTTSAKVTDGKLPEQTKAGGFTVQFEKGQITTTSQQPRQMEIDFICDQSMDPPQGAPIYGGEEPALHYNIKWPTKYACPAGVSAGTVILIIFFILVFVYIVGGCLFMKFVKHAEGAEIFPNVEFWVSVPGLIKDGALFIGSKTCCKDQYASV